MSEIKVGSASITPIKKNSIVNPSNQPSPV